MNSYLTEKKIIFKRREFKYLISEKDYEIIRQRLIVSLFRDRGQSENPEGYFIRSLYFDSIGDQALFEKLAGYDPRKKYRIRIYDLNDSKGKFEIKAKNGDCIHKTSFWINKDEIEKAQVGNYNWIKNKSAFLHHIFSVQKMEPVILVDYIRDAYVIPFNNLRITFDKNLEIMPTGSIYSKNIIPYKPMEGKIVMEIKFNGSNIPIYVKKLLTGIDAPRLAISKYVIGRLCFSTKSWQTY